MRLVNKILDIIYPPVCVMCGRRAKDGLCNKCENILQRQLALKIDDYTLDEEKNFDEHMYLYQYDGLIRNLILNYKFNQKSYLYQIFVKNLKNNKKTCLFLEKYDIIIPVPISHKRLKERGYNQSSLISNNIGKKYDDKTLIKTKNIQPQSTLKKEDRITNIENVYSITNNENIKDKSVLLFDDIYTTGSTVNECSRILKQAGAKNIGILTIAKD